ncbi:hypothetical protein BaRGS_00011897 [Batillaria attramentaria]|uniref:Uncharacterized protein n=1 Tax=Batillaria attramentaria TaxID=370345 RepID=A0ABD0LD79_9CAEN
MWEESVSKHPAFPSDISEDYMTCLSGSAAGRRDQSCVSGFRCGRTKTVSKTSNPVFCKEAASNKTFTDNVCETRKPAGLANGNRGKGLNGYDISGFV